MSRELACEIVKDLLPLYVDGMVSDVSRQSIESHLQHCQSCSEIYENMTFRLEKDKQPPEVGDVKRFLKKTKLMIFLYGFGGLSFLAVLVCMIVDLALNKGITWSLIVISALLFSNVLLYSLLVCKRNKGYIAMTVISVGTIILLSAIQISRYYLMHAGSVWIFRYGFPIAFLWLGIVWVPVLCRYALKWNLWDCLALLMFMALIGNSATNLITGDYTLDDLWNMHNFISNGLAEVIAAIFFVIIGRVTKWRR